MQESVLVNLLNALDIVVLEQNADGSFEFIGTVPEWFVALNPEVTQSKVGFWPGGKSDFISNFLIDAANFWATKDSGQLQSGPWIEHDSLGNAFELEATAVIAGQKRLLLLEKVGEAFQEKQAIIQKGREHQLDYLNLQRIKKNLLIAYEDLEKQVALRTAELVQANERLREEIAERQKAEEIKAKLQAQIRQAQKMEAIGTLAGGIAHDFNNILNAIMGYTELALLSLAEPHAPEKIKTYLEGAFQSEERAKELVKQILTISKEREKAFETIQIGPIINEALRFIRATIPTTIQIKFTIPDDLSTIVGDASQIHQIIMNLCTNAADAMEEKGGILEISLTNLEPQTELPCQCRGLRSGVYVLLSVRDTGSGMTPEMQERIFDPYFTTKETGRGTGLGLAVVQGIVKSHKGEISLESELGKGSIFRILLPAAEGELIKKSQEEEEVFLKGRERILIIEDEPVIANLVKQSLEKLGYQVMSMTNSLKALESFQQHPEQFDLIVSDLTMPFMTGLELAREFLAIRPKIPIILCSGFKGAETVEKLQALGIKAFVNKPYTLRKLSATIRQVLDAALN